MRNRLAVLLGSMLAATTSAACAPPGGSSTPAEASETLSAGSIAPNFSLASASGERFDLHAEAAKGPIVVVFYRGHW
jgi:cytochrome oxidase Cu insertion factor (SCO1/SenC/PrrC family)